MGKIKIIVAEDQDIFRKGLVFLLNSFHNIEVIQEVSNGKELLNTLEYYKPDIVTMDLNMPKLDGIEATRVIIKKFPKTKVIVLSMYYEETFISYLMKMGASAYITKDADPTEMELAIHEVQNNGYYLNAQVSKAISKISIKSTKKPLFNNYLYLSEREKEILTLICDGYTDKEIGDKLSLSKRTVDGHRLILSHKLGVHNTAMLVRVAVRYNLVDDLKPLFVLPDC